MAATAAAAATSTTTISGDTTNLWNFLDEDHVPWKKVLQTCRELPDDKPMLHFIIDRNPPPKYINDLLEIRQNDLLTGEATVIMQQHVWCYPIGIASMLSSDHVFSEIVMATKQALSLKNKKASTRASPDLDLLSGISVVKLPPKRLAIVMQHFPNVRTIKHSLLELLLFKHETVSWDVVSCILEHHPSLSVLGPSSDLGVSFFQILSDCCHNGPANFPPPHWITKIPKLVRYLVSHNCCSNPYLLRVALETLVPLLTPTTSKRSGSALHQKRRIIPEVLQVILEACPQSARYRCAETGRLPLHVAAHVEGCMNIVRAHPIALKTRCPVTKLYPFQLAALNLASENNNSSVEIGWNLLRAAPELLCMASMPSSTTSLVDGSSTVLTPQHLQLARHEMEMARTCRRFEEQRKALEQKRLQVLEQMTQERLELQQQLLDAASSKTGRKPTDMTHLGEQKLPRKKETIVQTRTSKRRRSS